VSAWQVKPSGLICERPVHRSSLSCGLVECHEQPALQFVQRRHFQWPYWGHVSGHVHEPVPNRLLLPPRVRSSAGVPHWVILPSSRAVNPLGVPPGLLHSRHGPLRVPPVSAGLLGHGKWVRLLRPVLCCWHRAVKNGGQERSGLLQLPRGSLQRFGWLFIVHAVPCGHRERCPKRDIC
jgi:hypothetical protein